MINHKDYDLNHKMQLLGNIKDACSLFLTNVRVFKKRLKEVEPSIENWEKLRKYGEFDELTEDISYLISRMDDMSSELGWIDDIILKVGAQSKSFFDNYLKDFESDRISETEKSRMLSKPFGPSEISNLDWEMEEHLKVIIDIQDVIEKNKLDKAMFEIQNVIGKYQLNDVLERLRRQEKNNE